MTSKKEEPILTMFDDHEIPYATLNNALSRLVKVLDAPLAGKETFTPVKLKKEHVDFFVNFHFLIFIFIFIFIFILFPVSIFFKSFIFVFIHFLGKGNDSVESGSGMPFDKNWWGPS